jgi:phosphoribosylamine---glycine ligase
MNILLLGSGGREHALAWKLAQSRLVTNPGDKLFAAPGNPGIAQHAALLSVDLADHAAVVHFCQSMDIGLVVVGPEGPLVDGLADSLRAAGVPTFGPSKQAARLEGSKIFTKDLCGAGGIPTAVCECYDNKAAAVAGLADFCAPYVIKADGLAAGKGVVIAETHAEAVAALEDMFGGGFGDAGALVVIEDFMPGEEVSFFAVTDGTHVVPFGAAQDHKRVGDGDTGLNTGGMGAYSPAPVFTAELQERTMREIIKPTVEIMRGKGMPYSGVLFAGLMLTPTGPKLIEYNCRFGDPECQVLMMRLESDLGELLLACAEGRLSEVEAPRFSGETALTVVMAAEGYPGPPKTGGRIDGIALAESGGAHVFQAGTALSPDGALTASGGRVLSVTAKGTSVRQAKQSAYAAIDALNFPDGFCRRDIGWRAIQCQN